jgi:hypothetical protein
MAMFLCVQNVLLNKLQQPCIYFQHTKFVVDQVIVQA